jgi:CHAT domain
MHRSLDQAKDQRSALRIRLLLTDCPELANLPWELLYDASDDSFVALSVETPVVRYLQLPSQPRAVGVRLPLEVLVIRSAPVDYPPLDLDDEWAQVSASVQELTDSGLVAFTVLAMPTLSELRRVLLRGEFHVVHYMGHGGFDPDTGGVLLFTDHDGHGVPLCQPGLRHPPPDN